MDISKGFKFEHKKKFPEVSKKKGNTNSERYRNSESTLIQKGYIRNFPQTQKLKRRKNSISKSRFSIKKRNHRFWLVDIDWSRDRIELILVLLDSEASI